MKILRGLLLAACLILAAPHSDARNKKHDLALKATFVLYGRSASKEVDHKALCTAFVYQQTPDGYNLLTAGHCFIGSNAPEDVQYFVADGQIVADPKNLQAVELLNAVDDGVMDVAEIHLKTDKKYPVLELDDQPAKIDDKVFYVGFPEMVSQVVYTGRVGSEVMLKSCADFSEGDTCTGRFLVQTGGGPGASGSPFISERTGKVVGILEAHEFENGVAVVPTPAIQAYYAKSGHSKNGPSEAKVQ